MDWYFASGDIEFFWKEQIAELSWLPEIFHQEYGFGFNGLLSLWLDYPYRLIVKLLSTLGVSWFFIEKLLWISVFVIAIYSSYKLTKHYIGSLIFASNTYILLLFSGGQLGVALAYAFAPFVLYTFEHKKDIVNGLWFGLLVALDIRLAFLIFLVLLFRGVRSIVPFLVTVSIHLYWILPSVFVRGGTNLGEQFTNPDMLKFLSFADYPHALSLLHPNWPENLFGKVYFLQPEFLLIPIIAFSALYFKSKNTRFFAILALAGVFFAKGVNGPFGFIFEWFFTHVPGFVMFRDPTKFYLLIAIGFSVLISTLFKKIPKVFSIFFIIFWIWTLRSVSITPVQIDEEYIQLKKLLADDPIPSRTLWIPQKEHFAYFSDTHPIVVATAAARIDPSIKYVIVPIDVNKRIFLDDYKFDSSIRDIIIAGIVLPRLSQFERIAVFENPSFEKMNIEIPSVAVKQQKLANIGLAISATFLIFWLIWIFLH